MHSIAETVREITLSDTLIPVSYLKAYRFIDENIKMPTTDFPYLYMVVAGSMRLHTPSGIMDYVESQYSISAIDTPFSGKVLTFSDSGDFLALSIEFSLNDVITVILGLDENLITKVMKEEIGADTMSNADSKVIEVVKRLVSVMNDPIQLPFMEQHLKQEIIFHVICGSSGKHFIQSIINVQQAGEIYEINSWIKANYRENFTVDELAKMKNMSVSGFHQKFRSAVGMPPLQCQKRLRLTEARRLMLDEGKNVTEAAFEVGYESVSQFIRDYRKMFSASPKEDIVSLLTYLAEKK